MSNTLLIVIVAAITFASRVVFMAKPLPAQRVKESPFLNAFPVALFVAIATVGLAAPAGTIAMTVTLWAGLGGIAGALLFRRSILAVVAVGMAAYWLARLVG